MACDTGAKVVRGGAVILFAALLLTACGDGGSGGQGVPARAASPGPAAAFKVNTDLKADPCALLPRDALAAHFNIRESDIRQRQVGSTCLYEAKGDRILTAQLSVRSLSDDPARVRTSFERSTRNLAPDELDKALARVAGEADRRDVPGEVTDATVGPDGILNRPEGIQFIDVDGIGERARFRPASGDLNVLAGNLYFEIKAYYGPSAQLTPGSQPADVLAATNAWIAETMPQRQQASEDLARVVLSKL